MFKWAITHEVPWLRTNHTVPVGTELGSMTPIMAEVALDRQTVASWVIRSCNATIGTMVFQTILLIIAVAKILVTNGCG